MHRPLEDGAFVLLAAGDDLGELVDAFVDGFAAAALDCGGRELVYYDVNEDEARLGGLVGGGSGNWLTFFVIVTTDFVPFVRSDGGFDLSSIGSFAGGLNLRCGTSDGCEGCHVVGGALSVVVLAAISASKVE